MKEKTETAVERDGRKRREAMGEIGRVMRAADALAERLRGPMARLLKLKDPIQTFHRGLAGGFTVKADHCGPVPGLHIFVHAREARVLGENEATDRREVRYSLEVSGPSELTEAEVVEVVKLLAKHRLPTRRWKHGKDGES